MIYNNTRTVIANLVDASQYFGVEELDLRMGLEVLDVFDLHEQAGHPLHVSLVTAR
jgi:hypothetical protein